MKIFFLLLIFMSHQSYSQIKGDFLDPRDNQTYETVTYLIKYSKDSLKRTTWMAQNLNYDSPESYPFDESFNNYDLIGRLYTWSAASNACPAEWRLPTDEDWYSLVNLFGGAEKAGRHLKAKKGLWPNAKGTNKSGFKGLPGGFMTGDGKWADYGAFFWSATKSTTSPNEFSDWSFISNSTKIRHWEGVKEIAQAVRCVKND